MIQHKKYDNETTDDMIKNENTKYKKSSYDEIRELVLEKEKGNNPVEDKIKKKKYPPWEDPSGEDPSRARGKYYSKERRSPMKIFKILVLNKRIIRNYLI